MAATHLTLEEAAQQLGISPEEFKRRLKTDPAFKVLVPIRDGVNLRFKPAAVEELARQLGLASNPELPLAALDDSSGHDSDDFKITSGGPKKASDEPLVFTDSSEDIFSLSADTGGASQKPAKPGSDSDIRLEGGKSKKPKTDSDASDASVLPTAEIDIIGGPSSAVIKGGSSSKLSAPKSGGKLSASDAGVANPASGDSSEFELSLDADSDDFELKLNTETSDEVALGQIPPEAGKRGGESGINLRQPADSGISLEKGKAGAKPGEEGDSDVDFELTLDSSSSTGGLNLESLKGSGTTDPDSDSEFELTLDDSGDSGLEHAALAESEGEKRDIFETDFEIPPMEGTDSESEAVAIEADSDLDSSDIEMAIEDSDVAEDSSGSEVVLLDDEEAPARGKRGVADADVDLADVDLADEDEVSASKALKGVKGRRRDEEEEEEEEELVPAGAAARPIPWGPLPVIFLLPALLFMLTGALLSYELLQTMWGYQQPTKPAAPIARELASALDMPLADQ
jgi:hypothetical protein